MMNKLLGQKEKACHGGPHLWSSFQPVKLDDPKDLVKLKCEHCGRLITLSNPTASMKSHLGGRNCSTAGRNAKRILEMDSARAAKTMRASLSMAPEFSGGAEDAARYKAIVEASSSSSGTKSKSAASITDYIFKCSKEQQDYITSGNWWQIWSFKIRIYSPSRW